MIFVAGVVVPDEEQYRYAVRWTNGDERPVLYRDGKRVCESWRIVLDESRESDKVGSMSSNTA